MALGSRRAVLRSLALGAVAVALSPARICPAAPACCDGICYEPCATPACGAFPPTCRLFPADNIWNARVDRLPVDPQSDAYVNAIGAGVGLHPDFGSGLWEGQPIGIPFASVSGARPGVPVSFDYADESDNGPYLIPPAPPIEGGPCAEGDRHVIVVDAAACVLYELYDAHPRGDGGWRAGSGAIFDLESNALRPDGWTSADAAGLPILPGLVRYEEVATGAIEHALRFTAPRTRSDHVWPARHDASSSGEPDLPPMGQRFRLRAGFDVDGFSAANRVILTTLQTYGMMLADNGSPWYLSGAPDERWDNDDLHQLQERVRGADFEAVDVSSLIRATDSGRTAQLGSFTAPGRSVPDRQSPKDFVRSARVPGALLAWRGVAWRFQSRDTSGPA